MHEHPMPIRERMTILSGNRRTGRGPDVSEEQMRMQMAAKVA
jgi:hypothetical protein